MHIDLSDLEPKPPKEKVVIEFVDNGDLIRVRTSDAMLTQSMVASLKSKVVIKCEPNNNYGFSIINTQGKDPVAVAERIAVTAEKAGCDVERWIVFSGADNMASVTSFIQAKEAQDIIDATITGLTKGLCHKYPKAPNAVIEMATYLIGSIACESRTKMYSAEEVVRLVSKAVRELHS